MSARRALIIVAIAAAAGVAVWARRDPPPAPPAPAPSPTVDEDTEEEPAPVEEEAPAPPAPPPRVESAAEFVDRLIQRLADTAGRAPAAREAVAASMIDTSSVVPTALGSAWPKLSFEQRIVAAYDVRALLAAEALRGAGLWLPHEPHVTSVEERGATARVRTSARDDIDVVFVLTRQPEAETEAFLLADVEVETVSFVGSYRTQVDRLLAKHDQDPAYILARMESKLARVRAGAEPR